MLYGAAVWDPVLIVSQIVAVQCLFYISLGMIQALFVGPYIGRLTIVYIFNWHLLSFRDFIGWMTVLGSMLNACLGAIYLTWIVERAKKCLDFASTCYLIHLGLSCMHSGFPSSFEWWATTTVSMLIMSLLGEWLCIRRELAEIPITALDSSALTPTRAALAAAASASAASAASAALGRSQRIREGTHLLPHVISAWQAVTGLCLPRDSEGKVLSILVPLGGASGALQKSLKRLITRTRN